MTSRGTTESRPGEPGYSGRGQTESYSPPTRPQSNQTPTHPFAPDEEVGDDSPYGESFDERVGQTDSLAWIDVIASEVATSLSAWGKNNGYSNAIMKNIYNQHAPSMFQQLQIRFSPYHPTDPTIQHKASTPEGMQDLVDWAINWFGGKAGLPNLSRSSGGGGGRGRGSGRSGPTAQDIRNRFDVEELTNGVNEMWRGILFEDNPQAKRLATEYVDAIVATKGEKKIDFATFVEERIKETSRFKTIYRNKPEHLSPVEYMSPYIQAARQFAAPDEADDIAVGGAQFGASPQAFQQRLMREDTVTGSTPFINGLEARLSNLNKVFAGS